MNKLENPEKKRINKSYKIEPDLYQEIKKKFKNDNKSISGFIRQTLIDYLGDKNNDE